MVTDGYWKHLNVMNPTYLSADLYLGPGGSFLHINITSVCLTRELTSFLLCFQGHTFIGVLTGALNSDDGWCYFLVEANKLLSWFFLKKKSGKRLVSFVLVSFCCNTTHDRLCIQGVTVIYGKSTAKSEVPCWCCEAVLRTFIACQLPLWNRLSEKPLFFFYY